MTGPVRLGDVQLDPDPRVDAMLRAGKARASEPYEAPPSTAELERQRFRRDLVRSRRFGLLPDEGELVAGDRLFETRALQVAKAWVETPRTYLTLLGDIGVGKSTAAAWATLRLAERGWSPVVYCIESEVTEWHRYRSTKHAATWERALEAEVLVVDELGDVDAADRTALEHARAALSELIHLRRGRKGRMIVMGNLKTEFAERVDDRTLSRLDDANHGLIELVEGEDLRRTVR